MHPLFFWTISTLDLAEREAEAQLLRRRRDSGIEQPQPLTRDERWVAAIHRWATAEPPQTAETSPAPAPRTTPRLGCA